MTHKSSQFTLVELMVAMAVLVIMMGFLFQFVIGAQRLWLTTSNNSSNFEQVQVLFDFLGKDLRNMHFSDAPDGSTPFYLSENKDLDKKFVTSLEKYKNYDKKYYKGKGITSTCLGFLATNSPNTSSANYDSVGAYPVFYYFRRVDSSGKPVYKLYRVLMDASTASTSPFQYMGKDTNAASTFLSNLFDSGDLAWSQNVIVDNVLEFSITTFPALTSSNTTSTRPKAIRISATVFDPNSLQNYEAAVEKAKTDGYMTGTDGEIEFDFENKLQQTARTFTKVIFLK